MDVVFTGHALDRSERVPSATLMQQSRLCGRTMNVRAGTGDTYRRDRLTGAVFACREDNGTLVVVTVVKFHKPRRMKAKDKTYGRRRPDQPVELEANEW